jgi:hypothetical protein
MLMDTRKLVISSLFGAAVLLFLPSAPVQADDRDDRGKRDRGRQDDDRKEGALFAMLHQQILELQARVAKLEALTRSMSLETVNDEPTVRFTGVNVQVVNGQGSTATANGTGNLIVGYDEPMDMNNDALFRCMSAGAFPPIARNRIACEAAGGSWLENFKTGSHYVIVGSGHAYSRWGGLIAGLENTINWDYASVSGGRFNIASGEESSVSGGTNNHASGPGSSVSGGSGNTASVHVSSVSGGGNNTASGDGSSVSGGSANTASVAGSSVAGGFANTASGRRSSVSGGQSNTASGDESAVLGGQLQNARRQFQTIPALP